jgi:acyl-CoA thioester hydrolase
MNQLQKFKQNYPVHIELPIQWGDMDAFNHVNNAMYFKYFESVRIAYFEKLGVMGQASKDNVAPILAETSCRFKYPLNFPDTLLVGSSIIENHSHGFLMEYGVYSKELEKITSVGTGRIVMLNYATHKKVEVDDVLFRLIKEIEEA